MGCLIHILIALGLVDWSKTATIRALYFCEIALLVFGLLVVIGIAGEHIYSDRSIEAVVAELIWSFMLDEAGQKTTKGKRLATISTFIVLFGVLGEVMADVGVFVFSARLETITNNEVASLTTQAATFRDDADRLSQQILTAQHREDAAEGKIADADRNLRAAEKRIQDLVGESVDQAHRIQQFTLDFAVYIGGLPVEPLTENLPSYIELLNHGHIVAAFVRVDPASPPRSIVDLPLRSVDSAVQAVNGIYELEPLWRNRLLAQPMKELDGIDSMNVQYGPFDAHTPELADSAKMKEAQILDATFAAWAVLRLNIAQIGDHRFSRAFFHREDYPDPMEAGFPGVPWITGPSDRTTPPPRWPAHPCVGDCGAPTFTVIVEAGGSKGFTFPTAPLAVAPGTTVNLPDCGGDQSDLLVALSTGQTNPISYYYQYHPTPVFPCGGTFLVPTTPDPGLITTAKTRLIGGQMFFNIGAAFTNSPYADVPRLFDSKKSKASPK